MDQPTVPNRGDGAPAHCCSNSGVCQGATCPFCKAPDQLLFHQMTHRRRSKEGIQGDTSEALVQRHQELRRRCQVSVSSHHIRLVREHTLRWFNAVCGRGTRETRLWPPCHRVAHCHAGGPGGGSGIVANRAAQRAAGLPNVPAHRAITIPATALLCNSPPTATGTMNSQCITPGTERSDS